MTHQYTYRLFIDGQWTNGTGHDELKVVNPATEEVIGMVPEGTVADAHAAILAARKAFDEGPWGKSSPRDRAVVLSRMADVIERRFDELVELDIAEAGSTRHLAHALQIGAPLEAIRDFADRVLPQYQFDQPMMPFIGANGLAGIGQGVIQREAMGVAALITPYNFPLFLNVFKVAPALAAGCTVVLKPSPDTPLEALILGEIAEEAGLPPGVLNIVTGGPEASAALTTHPAVDMVSFTGSDGVGRAVYKQAGDTLKRVVLELGGKSANVILEDADLEKVIPGIVMNFTMHAGQGCALLTRSLIHRSRFEEVTAGVTAYLDQLTVGDPADDAVDQCPAPGPRRSLDPAGCRGGWADCVRRWSASRAGQGLLRGAHPVRRCGQLDGDLPPGDIRPGGGTAAVRYRRRGRRHRQRQRFRSQRRGLVGRPGTGLSDRASAAHGWRTRQHGFPGWRNQSICAVRRLQAKRIGTRMGHCRTRGIPRNQVNPVGSGQRLS